MTDQLIEEPTSGTAERAEFSGVLRFYELAKKQEWQVRDLQRLREDLDEGVRLAQSLGLDVSGVQRPV
jgi:hypothetical protein